jgi:hypothetical protein
MKAIKTARIKGRAATAMNPHSATRGPAVDYADTDENKVRKLAARRIGLMPMDELGG